MQSTVSPSQALDLKQEAELSKYAKRAGDLGQLAQLNSILHTRRAAQGVEMIQKAEEAAAVKALTGQNIPISGGDDEMQTIVFGDMVTKHETAPARPGLSTLAKVGIAAAMLATGGIGAAIPIALSMLKPAAEVRPGSNSTIERDYSIGDVIIE